MPLTLLNDAYDSLVNVDAYWAARSNAAWAALTDEQAEVYIRQATDWIDRQFSFIGSKKTVDQRLKWPRDCAYDAEGRALTDTDAPWQVKEATAIVADLYRQGIALDANITDDSSIKKEKVDVIEVEYDTARRVRGGVIVPSVNLLLADLLSSRTVLRV